MYSTEAVSPFCSTLNTGYITGLDMCKHSVALCTRGISATTAADLREGLRPAEGAGYLKGRLKVGNLKVTIRGGGFRVTLRGRLSSRYLQREL